MAYLRRTARRGPRPEEIALLQVLASAPTGVGAGPLGRCLKRGWCRVRKDGGDNGSNNSSALKEAHVAYELTPLGRRLLSEDQIMRQ
jgi:hypothetical protein